MGRRFSVLEQQPMAAEGAAYDNVEVPYNSPESKESWWQRKGRQIRRSLSVTAIGVTLMAPSVAACGDSDPVNAKPQANASAEAVPGPNETLAPSTYNEQNVPLQYEGKEYIGTESFEKANEVLASEHPDPRDAIRYIATDTLTTWANWVKEQAGNEKLTGYQSLTGQHTGAAGILDDFVSPHMTNALTGDYSKPPEATPYSPTNLTDYTNSVAHEVGQNSKQNENYDFSFVIDKTQPDNGIRMTYNQDGIYAFHVYLAEKDNASEVGLPEDQSLNDKNRWLIVIEKQTNDEDKQIWKIVEATNVKADYDAE